MKENRIPFSARLRPDLIAKLNLLNSPRQIIENLLDDFFSTPLSVTDIKGFGDITELDEFLPENLEEIRDYVLEQRGEDISVFLHVLEERILLHDKDGNRLAWSVIGTLEVENFPDKIQIKIGDKRKIKLYFLRGWLEVLLYDLKSQIPDDINKLADINEGYNLFYYGEKNSFSLDSVKRYWKNRKSEKARFIDHDSESGCFDDKTICVFVSPKLTDYYYSRKKRKLNICCNFDTIGRMKGIVFQKANEITHAAIANCISWTDFYRLNQGDNMDAPTVLEAMEKLKEDASNDKNPISDEIKTVLRQLETKSFYELKKEEQDKINKAKSISPKIQLEFRRSQLLYIMRKKIEVYNRIRQQEYLFCSDAEEFHTRISQSSNFGNALTHIIKWISPIWEFRLAGQPTLASDIPKQSHSFTMNDGDIKIGCYWKASYIHIEWRANITFFCEIWARFINPETQEVLSEVFLSTSIKGERIFRNYELGFDPSKDRWSIQIILKEKEKE